MKANLIMMSALFRTALLLALAILIAAPATAFAQGCVESIDEKVELRDGKNSGFFERVTGFTAVIGKRDLFNSSGTRHTDFRAIIQQDRANLYRTGKADRFDTIEDQRETYFTTLEHRTLLSSARYYDYCWMSEEDIAAHHSDIVAGTVAGVIWVVIFRQADGSLAVVTSLAG